MEQEVSTIQTPFLLLGYFLCYGQHLPKNAAHNSSFPSSFVERLHQSYIPVQDFLSEENSKMKLALHRLHFWMKWVVKASSFPGY